ncbi:hypothetical protein QE197_07335 [Arsenophonus nasoniae]|uniref:Uncharacterized protein n=2 Tax=Arsenophonus nasoniae TaxID=638 RepID=A0A4P7L2U0_9GAMM|nr:hypothetical protein [Arsenophonus nasoniae]QBY43202.1 hypothetical protein ArsFIN_17690 [Arsenophonus nasoniae]QBY44166.1 hypothetical protein ArsFIN_27430 [Arsenophonus nasoniae]WGM04466.1 hypothetical protein QE258_12610 [Arsenophonus nasoniae]WGM07218.1 hypothetical protein QE258_08180 [Arsenophonus nasoniae]WGM09572.1 hypothetical protein QE197_11880 [Arsenophonus nasoniae]
MNPYAMQDYWYEQQQEIAYWEDRLDDEISELVQPIYDCLPSSVMRKLNHEDFDDIWKALFDHFKNENIHQYKALRAPKRKYL